MKKEASTATSHPHQKARILIVEAESTRCGSLSRIF